MSPLFSFTQTTRIGNAGFSGNFSKGKKHNFERLEMRSKNLFRQKKKITSLNLLALSIETILRVLNADRLQLQVIRLRLIFIETRKKQTTRNDHETSLADITSSILKTSASNSSKSFNLLQDTKQKKRVAQDYTYYVFYKLSLYFLRSFIVSTIHFCLPC